MIKITPDRFALGEHSNQEWMMTVDEDTEIADMLAPDFFGNVASKLRPFDKIRATNDTGSWYAELLVTSCGRNWAKAVVLQSVDLEAGAVDRSDGSEDYIIKYNGPHARFCVIRKADKAVIRDHLETKIEAANWLQSYLITS